MNRQSWKNCLRDHEKSRTTEDGAYTPCKSLTTHGNRCSGPQSRIITTTSPETETPRGRRQDTSPERLGGETPENSVGQDRRTIELMKMDADARLNNCQPYRRRGAGAVSLPSGTCGTSGRLRSSTSSGSTCGNSAPPVPTTAAASCARATICHPERGPNTLLPSATAAPTRRGATTDPGLLEPGSGLRPVEETSRPSRCGGGEVSRVVCARASSPPLWGESDNSGMSSSMCRRLPTALRS